MIRVFKEVETVSSSLSKEEPYEDRIPYVDLIRDNQNQSCRTDVESYKNPGVDVVAEETIPNTVRLHPE